MKVCDTRKKTAKIGMACMFLLHFVEFIQQLQRFIEDHILCCIGHMQITFIIRTHVLSIWEPVTFTLQALSLVEKAEPVQVHFPLRLRDQRSMWMQDGCIVYMDSYMVSNGSCFMLTWTILKNHLLEVGLTQNQETVGTPIYSISSCVRTRLKRKSLK
jgi:hypothetical protein